MPSSPTDIIRSLVGRYSLGYHMNPGGCEFFCPAHPSIRHCQIGEMGDEEDAAKLELWCREHEDELTASKPSTYIWYSEGEWPVRVINGRYFHRCTLSFQALDKDGKPEDHHYTFADIEEVPSGWRLIEADGGKSVFIVPDTPEMYAEWETYLFTSKP